MPDPSLARRDLLASGFALAAALPALAARAAAQQAPNPAPPPGQPLFRLDNDFPNLGN